MKGRAAASARVPCAPKTQKGRAPRIVRARVVCNAPLYFAAASALFVKGVPVWLSQKAETPFLRQAVHGKVEGNAQCVHPDALRQQQRREHEPVAAVGKAAQKAARRGWQRRSPARGTARPRRVLSAVFLISFPRGKGERRGDERCPRLPRPMSHTLPVKMLAIRQPTYSAGMLSA